MNFAKIGVLFVKEMRQGATNFFLVYALVMPVILSLLVALVFGDLFSETPRLGIYDAGDAPVVTRLLETDHIETRVYSSEAALRDAVERGAVMMGVVLPQGFESASDPYTVLYWSENVARNTAILNSTLDQALGIVPQDRVTIEAVQLGSENTVGWTERLLPMIVLMTIVLGGVLVPAASLVDEKQKRTLNALTITPVSLLDVYASKALLGTGISILMGLIVLILNSAFGGQPALLLAVLALSAIASSVFGVLLGSLVKDINVLLAVIKAGGLVLFAPALIQLAPDFPQWVARVFPTFYILNPVLEVSQNGAGIGDIAGDLAILLAIIGAMVFILVTIIERQQSQLALAG